ncbi:hypothetical protein BDV19DRAFT_358867 [Aspergillus venezuelensis]
MDNPSKRKLQGPSLVTESGPENDAPDKRRKVIGPAMPPPTADSNSDSNNKSDSNDDNKKVSDSDSDSNSDSDDDFGPSLPPPAGSAPQPQIAPDFPSQSTPSTAPSKPVPQRDAWMLAPPTSGSDRSRVDPTKLRNRKFQSGPRVGNASLAGGGVDSSWTETPEEKMRRLQDEAMGVRPSASSGGGIGPSRPGSEAEEAKAQAMREKVARYNEKVRGEESGSLVDEKKRKDKKEGDKEEREDDPSKRAFDKEKDMALSSKLTNAQRREMMSKAADFGSRFSKGKFL